MHWASPSSIPNRRILYLGVRSENTRPCGELEHTHSPTYLRFVCFPGDRAYAVEAGTGLFDPDRPERLPKTNFLMLMRDEKLASLATHLDHETGRLTVMHWAAGRVDAFLGSVEGRARIESYLSDFLGVPADHPLKIVNAPGHSFPDCGKKCVSIVNLASVRQLESKMDTKIDPRRFRANIYIAGWGPWAEFDLLGRTLAVGDTVLAVTKRIDRCAATNVDPISGTRDLNIPAALRRHYGHIDMGVYAEVRRGGLITRGNDIKVCE